MLLQAVPEIDNKAGEASYRERLLYMDRKHLADFVCTMNTRLDRDYFSNSLLGRAYARTATTESDPQRRKELLTCAREQLEKALTGARRLNDLIETSVQSWYLACVVSDLGLMTEAKVHLAEVRRLDEAIMARVPGLAWLRVAEYRFEVNQPNATTAMKAQKRKIAIEAMDSLGVVDSAHYVDVDYYF
jgi:hypothetical protein